MNINFDSGFGILDTSNLNIIKGSTIGDGFFLANDNKRLFLQSDDTIPGITIDSNNNIGIGKVQPSYKLDISGSVVAKSYKIQNDLLTIIDTSGNINSNGRLDISKNLTINTNKFIINSSTGDTSVSGAFDISNNINVNNKLAINSATGDISSNGNVDISGNLNLLNKFSVSSVGNTTITNTLDVSKNVIIRKTTTVAGALNVNNILYVDVSNNKVGINTTIIEPNYNLNIQGNTRIEGTLLVNGLTTVKNNLQTSSNQLLITNSGTGPALQVNQSGSQSVVDFKDDNDTVFFIKNGGYIGIGINNTNPSYNWDVSGNMNVSQNLILKTGLNVSGETVFNGNLGCGSKLLLTNGISINNNKFKIDQSGNMDISGNVIIRGALTTLGDVNQSGLFNLPGDFIINGNISVKQNVDVSQNLRINTNIFTVNNIGNITSKGNLDISKNFTLNNDVFMIDSSSGNIVSIGSLDISKNLRILTNKVSLDTSGNIKSSKDINVYKDFTINNNKFIVNSQNGNVTSAGKLDLSNNLSINANKFFVDLNGNVKAFGNLDISGNLGINTNKCNIMSTGNILSKSRLDISKNFNINSDKFMIDSSGNVKAQGMLDISNNFKINNDKFIMDTSGNISTKGNLDISGYLNINNNNFKIDSSGNIISKGKFDISKNFSAGEVLYIDTANKRIGINNSQPTYTLDVSESIATTNTYFGALNNTNDIIFSHRNHANVNNYALKQTKEGKTVINSKSTSGDIEFRFNNIAMHKLDATGNITIDGNLFLYSDQRIKKNIEYLDGSLDKLKYMRGVMYNLIKDPSKKRQTGVIAQEIEKVLPEVIDNKGEYKTVAYPNMVAFLIEVIKDINNKIDIKNANINILK
jgi:cytoskeletal protein CcmA (bactofilin family)